MVVSQARVGSNLLVQNPNTTWQKYHERNKNRALARKTVRLSANTQMGFVTADDIREIRQRKHLLSAALVGQGTIVP